MNGDHVGARSPVAEDDVQAVLETLRSGWLTMGPKTLELEQAFCEYTGAQHAVAVSSGAAALHISCLALGAGPGDEVIVPALSSVATAHAARAAGAREVLADCVSATEPLIDPTAVERLAGKRTSVAVATHAFGYPADVEALLAIGEELGLAVIEDCTQAAGARLRDGSVAGTAGVCGCFSFSVDTHLGSGEGGIIVTDSEELAGELKKLRSHAMTSVTWDRHRGHAETYDVTRLGFNFRIDEPRATLARARLGRLEDVLAGARKVVGGYREGLAGVDGVDVPFPEEWTELSGHSAFPVLVADRASRDSVRASMRAHGIEAATQPSLTQLSLYKPRRPEDERPVAEGVADRLLLLPVSRGHGENGVDGVLDALASALN